MERLAESVWYNSIINRLNLNASENSLQEADIESIVCRICLKSSSPKKLISPCICSGSVEYVHEDCLKAWILAQGKIGGNHCELCHNIYKMDYRIGSKCNPAALCRLNRPLPLMNCCLVGLLVIKVLIIGLLCSIVDYDKKKQAFTILLSICLALFAFLLIALAITTLKIVLQKTLAEWNIYSTENVSSLPAKEMLPVLSGDLAIPSTVSVNGIAVVPPCLSIPVNLQQRLNAQRHRPSIGSPQSGQDSYQHLVEVDSLRVDEVCFHDSAAY